MLILHKINVPRNSYHAQLVVARGSQRVVKSDGRRAGCKRQRVQPGGLGAQLVEAILAGLAETNG